MKRAAFGSWLGFGAVLMMALGIHAAPARATSIGLLPAGASYSDVITSSGPTFSQDYSFTLDGGMHSLTVLATALAQTSSNYGVDLLDIALYDSSSTLIASASGAPVVSLDSFAQSGLALGPGAYVFSVMGQVTAGKDAYVLISLAANDVAQAPIPSAGLMLLTGLGLFGGLGLRRRRAAFARSAAGA
jgi:hypothetical protein